VSEDGKNGGMVWADEGALTKSSFIATSFKKFNLI